MCLSTELTFAGLPITDTVYMYQSKDYIRMRIQKKQKSSKSGG
jgi:hypothetical protein